MEETFFKITFLASILLMATSMSFSAVSRADGSAILPCKIDSDCKAIECESVTARCVNNNCQCDIVVGNIIACKHDKDCVKLCPPGCSHNCSMGKCLCGC